VHPSAPPVVALPSTTGPAGADPDTERWLRAATSRLGRCLLATSGALAVAVAGVVVAVREPDQQNWADQVISLGLVAALVTSLPVWSILPGLRHRAVLAAHGWRPVTAKVVRGGPDRTQGACVLLAAVGDQPAHLRAPALLWPVQRVVLATGRIWLCGPDARGRAMLRADGLCGGPIPATVVRRLPAGQAPAVPGWTGCRPADDPQVGWLVGVGRQRLRLLRSVVVLLVVVGGAALIPGDPLAEPMVGVVLLLASVGLAGVLVAASRRQRLLAALAGAATAWTPLPARLVSWTPRRGMSGPADAVLSTVGAEPAELSVRLPAASATLVANLAASGTLWLLGDPLPGGPVAVGLPGYPVLELAELGRPGPATDR
jgi:hypothetical protein